MVCANEKRMNMEKLKPKLDQRNVIKPCCKNCKNWNNIEDCPYCLRGMYADECCQWFDNRRVQDKQ